jgi:hypothetical protein
MTKIDALTKTWLGETTEKVAVIHAAFEDAPTTVAFVEIDAALPIRKKLEIAFVKTNTITEAWWRNDGVTYIGTAPTCRSTSVGDMVLIGKDKYVCGMVGWTTLDRLYFNGQVGFSIAFFGYALANVGLIWAMTEGTK